MPGFRVELQGANALKTDMNDTQRQLDDLRWDAQNIRRALSFNIKARENIEESLRRIEGALEAQGVFAHLLAQCGQDSVDVYRTTEQSVLGEYGVDIPGEVPLWKKVLMGCGALTMTQIAFMNPSMFWIGATLAWGAYARVAEGDGSSLFHGDVTDINGNILGIPVSIRGDMDVLGYEQVVGDNYDAAEVRSYLFRSNLDIQVGDFYGKNMSLSVGNTDSYLDTNVDDAWKNEGILELLLALTPLGFSGDALAQGSLLNYHVDERLGSEQYNLHRSDDFYLGEAHAQGAYGTGQDFESGKKVCGAGVDFGASAVKAVKSGGYTISGISVDGIGGVDVGTIGKANKVILTDKQFEIGKGFGGGKLGGYAGLKIYTEQGWTAYQQELMENIIQSINQAMNN